MLRTKRRIDTVHNADTPHRADIRPVRTSPRGKLACYIRMFTSSDLRHVLCAYAPDIQTPDLSGTTKPVPWSCCLWVASVELAAAYINQNPTSRYPTYTLSTAIDRDRQASPYQPCKSQDADNHSSCFFPFLLCQHHAKVPCVWCVVQPAPALHTPDPNSSNGLGEPRSARRLSRGMGIAVRS